MIFSQTQWAGTWATSQQLTETANLPPSPGLPNNTLRQIVHVSIGGSQLRVLFSNSIVTATQTATPTRTVVLTNTPAGLKGDVNKDGTITIIDALMITQYYVGLITDFLC